MHCSAAFASLGPHPGSRDRDTESLDGTGARRHAIRFMSSPGAAGMRPAAFFMPAWNPQPMTVRTNEQAADRLKINVRDAWEPRWCCGHFGCTEAQLKGGHRCDGRDRRQRAQVPGARAGAAIRAGDAYQLSR